MHVNVPGLCPWPREASFVQLTYIEINIARNLPSIFLVSSLNLALNLPSMFLVSSFNLALNLPSMFLVFNLFSNSNFLNLHG